MQTVLAALLQTFPNVSTLLLPPFKAHHVGRYWCGTRPGVERQEVHLYTEDHRQHAVARLVGPGLRQTKGSGSNIQQQL